MVVSVFLHSARGPSPAEVASMRAMVEEVWSDREAELVAVTAPLEGPGPSAALNAAATAARGNTLVFVEAGTPCSATQLRALAAAAHDGLARLGEDTEGCVLSEQTHRVGDCLRHTLDWPTTRAALLATASRDPGAWAASRDVFQALGGLDARFWLYGAWQELAHRARAAHKGVEDVAWAVPTPVSDDAMRPGASAASPPAPSVRDRPAYPLDPAWQTLLGWHNALVLAYLHADADAFGSQLAVTGISALAESWHASGLDMSALRFGARWSLHVVDERAALLPLLAVDAFARRLPTLGRKQPRAGLYLDASENSPPTPSQAQALQPMLHTAEPAAVAPAREDVAQPVVSVIVVNWNGKEHLEACFSSLEASHYPEERLELVCVDNGSTDGSVAWLGQRFPRVRVVALPENRGFTGGNEAGVADSRGDVLVFLNNDMRVEPDAIPRLVGALTPGTDCTAARVLSWNGRAIDFLCGTINFEGRGYQEHYGEPSRSDRSSAQPTFFPNGGAFAVTRQAYQRAGGFDSTFFAYYDDVDLGWRLRIAGSDIRVVKEAVVYHRHGATSRKHPSGQKRYLMERNALWTIFKCYAVPALRRTFGAAVLLAIRRLLQDVRRPSLAVLPGFDAVDLTAVPRTNWKAMALESYAAIAAAAARLPAMVPSRNWVQAHRRASDSSILPTFGRGLEYSSRRSSYMAVHDALTAELALPHVLRGQPRVLIVTHEGLKRNMSGPAIRALELGRALGRTALVTVAAPGQAEISARECVLASYTPGDGASLRELAERADVLVVWGLMVALYPFLRRMHVPIVVDLYCPFTLEYLEMKTGDQSASLSEVARESANLLAHQNELLEAGDFFICASERQRDFWLGALHTAGRVNTSTYAADTTLRKVIDVVPFGISDEPFAQAAARSRVGGRALKGRHPGIGLRDNVLLWGGSMLDWQDPEVVVAAVAEIARTRNDVKLFFMGTKHPNPHVVPARVIERSRQLAERLGLLDRHVFFNDWVPYEERAAYLQDADLGISTHTDHLETRFAFRTRMLDYIWAGLPIVCTAGDHFGDLVQSRRLGRVVPAKDPRALAAAILDLLDDADEAAACRDRLAVLAEELRWSRVVEPLARYVAQAQVAPDHEGQMQTLRRELGSSYRWTKWAKRTALALGVGEGTIEQVKGIAPVRAAMSLRNKAAYWKATRKARRNR